MEKIISTDEYIVLGQKPLNLGPVGNKAALLHQAAAAGLPVPSGFIIPHSPSPHPLPSSISLNGSLAVRSAFSAEDTAGQALAGFFETRLNVANEPAAVWDAYQEVYSSADRLPADGPIKKEDVRRDVLVMQMVAAQTAGVAFTQPDFADDLINFTAGLADKLVGGQVEGKADFLPKREKAAAKIGFEPRLQALLQQVRRVFGDQQPGWDIEWADDGERCWLVQIRPITRPPRRNEAFTYANIREIMPDPPSPLMASIVAEASSELYAYYRSFDQTLPDGRPMIELFAGRPFFNLSLLIDTMRHWGLPTSLVTNSIGGSADREFGLNPGRFLAKSPVLLKQGWAQLTAVRQAEQATLQILSRTQEPGETLAEVGETLRWLFTRLVTEMFNLTAALSGPLLLLRLSNTLAEHNGRHRAVSTEIFTDLAPLQTAVAEKPAWKAALEAGELPRDPRFQEVWQRYLDKHGMRGIYESDIARPRYHEDPSPLLRLLLSTPPAPRDPPSLTWKARLTWPIWWQCRRVLSAREWWRYHAMICYNRIRQRFLKLAAPVVEEGRLPSPDHLWQLELGELAQLDEGWRPDDAFWDRRAAEFAEHQALDIPDLLFRFDDLEQFGQSKDLIAVDRLKGISLTGGTVHGRAWVLSEPAVELPEGFVPEDTILIARSVDAGWIATFSQVAGVAIEIGGDLSHGSIILREIGLPAVTNVKGLTQAVKSGDEIELKAGNGIVKIAKG
ncbi:MAG: PEP/pyruvate-binding domain-containing protein [Ardenticatenaceae bacterium]|nr:PEP/pyruvate-binding domain-containing protein [Ardenticatenaceae bacterium]